MSSSNDLENSKTGELGAIGSSVRSAMIWNTAAMALSQVGLSVIFIVLVNRIDPHTFGLFALAAVFVDFFYSLGSSASVDALLQRQDFSRRTLSTAYWCITVVAAGVTAGLISLAPLIGQLADDPAEFPVLVSLALTLLPMPLSIGPTAVMRQNLDFRGLALRNMLAAFAGGIAALIVAFTPYAVWALVVQRWVSLAVSIGTVMIATRVTPKFEFDWKFAPRYLSATGRISAAQGIAGSSGRVFDLMIAIFFGTVILGCVRVATKLLEIVTAAFLNPIGQLWIVMVGKAGASMDKRRNVFLQLSKVTAMIAVPAFVGTGLIASEITALTLTPDYAPVALILLVMAGTQVLVPISNPRNGLLTSLGHLNILVVFALIDLGVMIGLIVGLQHLGLAAALIGWGFSNLLSLCFAVPFTLKKMGTSLRDYVASLAPPYLATSAMVAAILIFQASFPDIGPWAMLLGKISVGGLAYLAALFIVFRRWSRDVVAVLRSS